MRKTLLALVAGCMLAAPVFAQDSSYTAPITTCTPSVVSAIATSSTTAAEPVDELYTRLQSIPQIFAPTTDKNEKNPAYGYYHPLYSKLGRLDLICWSKDAKKIDSVKLIFSLKLKNGYFPFFKFYDTNADGKCDKFMRSGDGFEGIYRANEEINRDYRWQLDTALRLLYRTK